jgi:integrase
MRKARHYVGYQEVEAITSAMRKDRDQAEETHKGAPASIAMHELLIRFLLILAWRQRNLRELRVFGSNPNLFKGPIPRNTGLNTPPWVDQELERNPNAEFWQFAFSKDETKSNVAIHAVLPRKLVDPLEEYLEKYRPKLVQGHDPGTLFVNTHRSALDQTAVSNLVGSVTGKYCGVRVAPHRFRDLLAYEWLRLNPKDYLTLSKILWHKNVDMTIKKYGARFNESSGVCAVDAWLDERAVACV